MKETNVGLGEFALSRDPNDVLVAYGLGSCLGIVITDSSSRMCGLLHAVLPRLPAAPDAGQVNPCKFVDVGIEHFVASLVKSGANRSKLVVRLVGGANMLPSVGGTHAFDIGTRNIEAAHAILERLKIPIVASDVGGHTGRTVRVYVVDSRVTVRVIGQKEHEI